MRARLARVKLLVLDVDGVLTDGSLYYTEREEIKKFHVRDGQGIKLAQQAGIAVALLSGNASAAVEQRARVLGIPYVFLGVNDKLTTLEALCARLGLSLAHVAYVGDDVNDLPTYMRSAVLAPLLMLCRQPCLRHLRHSPARWPGRCARNL